MCTLGRSGNFANVERIHKNAMNKKLFLFLLVLIPFSGMAQIGTKEPLRLTLQDCLYLVNENNYNRQSVALSEEASRDLYNQSKMERLPNLTASVGETYSHTNSTGSDWTGNYSASTAVTIYQGGYINSTIEKSRLSAEQAEYKTAQYDNELTIQVLEAFLAALGNEELLRYQSAVVEASEEQVRQGKARLATGDILESDYLLLEAQRATDNNNVLETQVNRDNSLNILKGLMSMDMSVNIEIVYPDDSILADMGILPSEDEVLARSFETLPDIRISDYNVEIAESGVKISRSAFAPTISASGSVGSGHMNDFSKYGNQLSDRLKEQVGVTVSIPIFNRGRTKSNVLQSKIALRQAELEQKQTLLDIEQTLLQEYRGVIQAESKYRASDIRRNAYSASFDAYRVKFEQDAITAVDLLQQQNNYISAMNDYIQSKYGFMLKRKVLDVYMGEPVTL